MSAHPFGGHPGFLKFKEYTYWAATVEKCRVQTGYLVTVDGEVLSSTTITAPSGKHVIVVDVSPEESVSLTEIAHYDRRLGIQWPGANSGSAKP
jgi:hypothetical protein